jgi:hypothetical protein
MFEKMSRQNGYLLAALTKRRNVYPYDIQSVKQVLSKAPVFDRSLKICVGSGEYPDVYPHRFCLSERLNLALLKETH